MLPEHSDGVSGAGAEFPGGEVGGDHPRAARRVHATLENCHRPAIPRQNQYIFRQTRLFLTEF